LAARGNPDDAWKSRIFNNLWRTFGGGQGSLIGIGRAGGFSGPGSGRLLAIVVLVE
jgi:hypothetical protein